MEESAELVLIPWTARGHLAAALEFAKLVVDRDDRLSITVLIVKLPLDPTLAAYADSLAASFAPSQRIKFVFVENQPTRAEETATNPVAYVRLFVESHRLNIRNSIKKLFLGSGNRRLVGFVLDMMLSPLTDMAEELGVPAYVFWTCSAGLLSLKLHLMRLRDCSDKPVVDWPVGSAGSLDVPGFVKPVPAHAFPSPLIDKASANAVLDMTAKVGKAKGVVVNTSAEIEPHAVASLASSGGEFPQVYPVGPILNLTGNTGDEAFSVAGDGADITRWLDGQPHSSVIFLCFGSRGSFGAAQVKEIATALERTGFRFLWALRYSPPEDKVAFASGVCFEPAAILPDGFLNRVGDSGRVISWAPQTAVLAHPAVGGFVSHCGWNSVLESLWFGVPVAAWPLFAEQQLNAFQMATELGTAVEVKSDYRASFDTGVDAEKEAALVSASEIEAAMRRVMEGESEVRKRVKEMSEKCRKSVVEGGSSRSSLDSFVSDVFRNSQLM